MPLPSGSGIKSAPGCWATCPDPAEVWLPKRCSAPVRWRGRWTFIYPKPHTVVVESCDEHWQPDGHFHRIAGT